MLSGLFLQFKFVWRADKYATFIRGDVDEKKAELEALLIEFGFHLIPEI